MEFTLDYASLLKKLEIQELESGRASAEVYGQLLALYILFSDLTSAKFLWKRIPDEIKTSNDELLIIWRVGKSMWKKNYSEVYGTINSCPTWPNHLKNIMKLILDSTRQRMTNLIHRAYSNIRTKDASQLLGLTPEETIEFGQKQGWLYEAESDHFVIDRKAKPTSNLDDKIIQRNKIYIDAEVMSKLTDYIVFLESTQSP